MALYKCCYYYYYYFDEIHESKEVDDKSR